MGIISKTFTMLSAVMDYPVIYSISFFLLLSRLHIPIKSFISSFLRKLPLCIAADSWRKCVSSLCRALFARRWQLTLAQTSSRCTGDTQMSNVFRPSIFFGHSTHPCSSHVHQCCCPSLPSLCHHVIVSCSVYSVINHHLEGSAGSKQKRGYSCRWFLSD